MTASNRFTEMETFVAVVEHRSMSAAARSRGTTPSAISKIVSRLEDRLAVRLLQRSTRLLELTPEGDAYYASAVQLLRNLNDAEQTVRQGTQVVGHVRVSTSAGFGVHILVPLLSTFMCRYPGIALELVFTDDVIELVGNRTDVAIRAGALKDSQLVARKLGEAEFMTVASPSYLSARPSDSEDSAEQGHTILSLTYRGMLDPFVQSFDRDDGQPGFKSHVGASDSEALRHLCLKDVGIACLPDFTVRDDLLEGRLVAVRNRVVAKREPFYAIYLGGHNMPARTRAFLDFLVETVVMTDQSGGRPA